MARRDFRSQYRQSVLGISVVLLFPLALTALALGFRSTGILHVDSADVPYPLFVLVGVILWTTFIEALNAPIYGFLGELRLLARTNAPPEAIVLSKLGGVLLNLLVKLVLLLLALLWYRTSIPSTAALAPIGLASLFVLGTAFGLLIAPINLLYRDVSWVVASLTTIWFFFSPVYFPASSGGSVGVVMRLNPVTPLLSNTRSLLLTGTITTPGVSLLITVGACLLLVISWLFARVVLAVAIEQVNE
jgi:lipopolysaccharide transport system permease protein